MKVICEIRIFKEDTLEDKIDKQINLLNYTKKGYEIEMYSFDKWIKKEGLSFGIGVKYRVVEKPKEVTVYTMIYVNSCGKIYSWGTENKEHFDTEVNNLDFVGCKLLKTHVDKVVIS